jgi:hypothetical protein
MEGRMDIQTIAQTVKWVKRSVEMNTENREGRTGRQDSLSSVFFFTISRRLVG